MLPGGCYNPSQSRARALSPPPSRALSLSLLTLQNTFTQQTCTGRTVPLEGIACLTRRESIAAATEFATSGMEQSGMLGGSSGPALFGGRVSSSPITVETPGWKLFVQKKNLLLLCNTVRERERERESLAREFYLKNPTPPGAAFT